MSEQATTTSIIVVSSPWLRVPIPELLTPRGGPRHQVVVGVNGKDRWRAVRRCRRHVRGELTRPYGSCLQRLGVTATNPQRTALCAGRDTRLHHCAKWWGREQPPRFLPYATPLGSGRVAHAPCQCRDHSRDVPVIRAPFARALSCAYAPQIARGSHRTFDTHSATSTRAASAITSRASICARPRQGSSLRSDPLRGPADLDDACAQLEGSTYVMAEEARCIFSC